MQDFDISSDSYLYDADNPPPMQDLDYSAVDPNNNNNEDNTMPEFDFDAALNHETPARRPTATMTSHVASLLGELGDLNTMHTNTTTTTASSSRPGMPEEAVLVQRMTLALPKDDLLQRLAELDRLKSAEEDLASQLARLEAAVADGNADLSKVVILQNQWRELNARKTLLMTEGLPNMTGSATEISSSSEFTDDELLGSSSDLLHSYEPPPEEPSSSSSPTIPSFATPFPKASLTAPQVRMSFDEDDVDEILSAAKGSSHKLLGGNRPAPAPIIVTTPAGASPPPHPRVLPNAAQQQVTGGRTPATAPGSSRPLPSAPASRPLPPVNSLAGNRGGGRGVIVVGRGGGRGVNVATGRGGGAAAGQHVAPAAAYPCTLCKQSFPKSQLALVRHKPFCASCKARLAAQAKQRGMNL
jgi:hypothetical protein